MTETTLQTTEVTTTVTTTTLVPGITQPDGLAPLDLLARFPMQQMLLERFSPNAIVFDRYLSPLWLPFALIGCTVCMVVYAFASCKCFERPVSNSSRLVRGAEINLAQSVYLACISIVQLIRAILVILIDLDTAWDTGILAWNQLFCPLIHTLSTASKLASALLTLFLGIESLAATYPKSTLLFYCPFRFCVARGRYRRSQHIAIALVLTSLAYGFVETAYWRVQYYLPTTGSHGLYNSYQDHAPSPLARCEVTGSFHHMFTSRLDRSSLDGFLDETTRRHGTGTRLAASYADYTWISGITVDSILSLASICVALAVLRSNLMNNMDRSGTNNAINTMGSTYSVVIKQDLGHVIALNLIQGLCRLPEEIFTMLEPLTRPGEFNLTDAEIELDGTWQRYFMMLTARVICRELADLPGACLLPSCLILSSQFRKQFCDIFGCWFLCWRKPMQRTYIGGRPGSVNFGSHQGSCTNPMSELSGFSTKPYPPDFSQGYAEMEQPRMNNAPMEMDDGPRPLWKWGQGWVMSQPSVERRIPLQYSQMKRTLTSSDPLYHPSDKGAVQHQSRFVSYARGVESANGQTVSHSTYQQRAASVNDILYDPRLQGELLSKSLPRVNNKAEWFEPRSYV